MSVYRTDGIVLRVRNLGEADKALTLLTRGDGKVEAAARGARRSRSRLLGSTQLFTFGRFLLFRRQGLHALSQVEILEPFLPLRENLVRMAYASYAVELADRLLAEGDRTSGAFPLLLGVLHLLAWEKEADLEAVVRKYELRLMALCGYRPELEACVRCGRAVQPGETVGFGVHEGGVLCSRCFAGGAGSAVGWESLAVMREILSVDLSRLRIVRPSVRALAELKEIVPAWVDHYGGTTPLSRAFLDALQAGGS